MKVVFSARALRHLDEIHLYITRMSFETRADAYINRIDNYCQSLSTFPERGSPRDDILTGLRLIGFERSTTIAFTIAADEIIIEAVLYGGRSPENMLKDKA